VGRHDEASELSTLKSQLSSLNPQTLNRRVER
jgi:hypothetical protein